MTPTRSLWNDIAFGLFCWLMHVLFLPLTMAIREAIVQ